MPLLFADRPQRGRTKSDLREFFEIRPSLGVGVSVRADTAVHRTAMGGANGRAITRAAVTRAAVTRADRAAVTPAAAARAAIECATADRGAVA